MIKSELIKARCTSTEKQYLIEYMHSNSYRTLSEAIRAIINNHMIVNPMLPAGGANDVK